MHIIAIALAFVLLNVTGTNAIAQQRHIHSGAGVSPTQLPFWTARELGIFDKYSLSVELVVISSGPRGMQALLGGSLQSANMFVMRLLAGCRYGQHQLCDPEGNPLDVFE